MDTKPVNVTEVLASFSDTYSPRIVARVKPSSPGGAVLMSEPTGTSSTGNRHEGELPDHVDSTTGHELT